MCLFLNKKYFANCILKITYKTIPHTLFNVFRLRFMEKTTPKNPKLMSIGEKIKFFRTLKGLKQADVAERMGIDVKSYQNIETDKTDVSISRLQELADVFGIDLFELFGVGEKNFYYVHTGNQANTHGSIVVHAKNENEKDTQIENQKLNLSLNFAQEKISLLENEITHLNTIIALLQKDKE